MPATTILPSGWRAAPPPTPSVGPEALDRLFAFALGTVGADRDQLESRRASLERRHDVRRDAEHVPLTKLDDLLIKPRAARPTDDDVCLLLLAVAVAEWGPDARLIEKVADAEVL